MTDGRLLAELNRDVWRPFQRAYADLDPAAFLALHSPDLIRAGGPARRVLGFDDYATETSQSLARLAQQGERVAIEFRFVERLADGDLASERGVFRISITPAAGERLTFYSRFHTLARRIENRWLIVADYDSDDGGTVNEDVFNAATELDDLAAFEPGEGSDGC
jgi:uncharacterized protein (TIGR02246 family)